MVLYWEVKEETASAWKPRLFLCMQIVMVTGITLSSCGLDVFSYMPLCVLDLTKVFQPFLGILLKIVVERYSTQINKKTVQAWTKK